MGSLTTTRGLLGNVFRRTAAPPSPPREITAVTTTFPVKLCVRFGPARRGTDGRRKHSSYKTFGVRPPKYFLLSVVVAVVVVSVSPGDRDAGGELKKTGVSTSLFVSEVTA